MNKPLTIAYVFVASTLLVVAKVSAQGNPNGGFEPVTLCHATGSATNPYNEITVDNQGQLNGHLQHDNDIIPAPADGCPTGEEPTDVCPNIEGVQETVPEGYELQDGQCVEIPTDVCPNIEGVQESVPNGYELVEGQCVEIPVDVCPNLEGNQAEIPEGYELVENECVLKETPTDVCANLEGVQTEVPAGYVLEGDQCVLQTEEIRGCTDPKATNYDSKATVSDNSCKYEEKHEDNDDDDDNDDEDDNDDHEEQHEESGRGGIVLGATTITKLPNTSSR